jgi:hypothetical protein
MPWLPLGLDYQVIDSKSEYQKFSFNVKRFGWVVLDVRPSDTEYLEARVGPR